jgi:uncharacterized membrane protein YccF (DUF307 family)
MAETLSVPKVKEPVREIPFLIRVIWFFVLGWELTGVWILIAWALNASIIGLPLGVWMIDRVPQVLTLKARPGAYVVDLANGQSRFLPAAQPPFLLRAVYFVVIGWWFSLLWAAVAWLLCATILGLPLGVLMLNALPLVTTLQRS